ncbi:MAG: hypothetical protein ACJA09_003229 [Alcanivorax sp.]|jgi:hypothetical protein
MIGMMGVDLRTDIEDPSVFMSSTMSCWPQHFQCNLLLASERWRGPKK